MARNSGVANSPAVTPPASLPDPRDEVVAAARRYRETQRGWATSDEASMEMMIKAKLALDRALEAVPATS